MSAIGGRSNKISFCDFDGLKKKELERRKKVRLEQVRTQSKELSTKIRDRVAREKDRQLRNVEEIKRKELLSWKEKHVNNTMADYYYCLSNVGDAHVAAERENELTEKVDEQQRKNRKIAAKRGQDALQRERLTNVKKNERPAVKRKQQTYLVRKNVSISMPSTGNALDEEKKILSDDDAHQLSDSDGESASGNVEHIQDNRLQSPDKPLDELVDKPKESAFRFSQVSDLIEERRRARNLCDQMLHNEFGTSEPEVPPKFTQQQKSPQAKSLHAPSQAQPVYAPKSPKRQTTVNSKGSASKSHQLSHVDRTTAGNKGFNSQRSVVASTRKVTTPNKISKAKNVITPSKFVSPQRREFVPRFTKPGILKNPTLPENTEAMATQSPEKVQFYDHFSRYGKEYDADPGMVIRETHQPTMDANEAARVQNEMDELRFQQLEELRRKSEQRSKESLQRNQVRKDYDNLTKELDKLCEEENRLRAFAMPPEQFSEDRISQMARNRQQNMNRAFEDICHRPVVITCPPIGSNEISSSSDINVATSPQRTDQQQPKIDPFDSSDSCTSILLGYVDNRSRKLVKDIKQCKDGADGDKRMKLVTLLTRLDDLRKLLMEEIVRNSSLNLEPFYRSVLEVETEKKEILHDPLGNKENGDLKTRMEKLDRREQTVQSQEAELEKKIRELFRKEQRKVTAPRDDDTFESTTSETMTSNVDPPQPVKILIEVKNGAKIRKSSHPKKGRVDTLIVVPQRQHKTSVGSSASTAYRSPPASFHTEFTKVLSNQADAKAMKVSMKSDQQPSLAHYITRLLGMSQKSVDQLGVSTGSSIATPSDSVIDVTENRSVIDANHLSRVQARIDESLRLVKEVDDSFKQTKNRTETKMGRDSREQKVESSNERQAQTKKNMKTRSDVVTKIPDKLKKVSHKTEHSSHFIGRGHSDGETAALVPDIPENSKRIIADLTKQIEQVRQEKQKLLEKTSSSAHNSQSSSGKDFDLTEYKEFAATTSKSTSKPAADEVSCSSQASDVQSLPGHFANEESKNLMSSKQIGISFSRDSGIGSSRPASRPVTSTDFRISPDIKITEKLTTKEVTTDLPMDRVDSLPAPEDATAKLVESGCRKSAKPPISLKRYSPQLDTEHLQPHDLSTINEVETSAASRLNQSTRNEISGSPVPTPYTRFPTFAEYAKMQEMVSNASSDGDNSCSETILRKMLEITCLSETDLNYRKWDKTHPKDQTTNEKSTNTGTISEFIDVEKEMKKRRLLECGDSSSASTSDSKMASSSTSTDLLAKDFNRIGLNWASAMLKKTSTAQNLESSSSSIKSTPHFAQKAQPMSGGSSPGDRVNGNPLNIRDFLTRELLKRSQLSTSSSMSDSSTLTDQFLKSLITISSESSLQQQATLRTSTPNRNNQSSESEKFVPAHDIGHTAKDEHLFSGDSILSSVRGGISQSDETSGARDTSE